MPRTPSPVARRRRRCVGLALTTCLLGGTLASAAPVLAASAPAVAGPMRTSAVAAAASPERRPSLRAALSEESRLAAPSKDAAANPDAGPDRGPSTGLPRGVSRRVPGTAPDPSAPPPAAGSPAPRGPQSRPDAAPEQADPVAPRGSLTAAPASRFTVNFVNDSRTWSPAAKAAFTAATDIWSRSIESTVPIVVTATATNFGDPDILGGASPADFLLDDRGTAEPRDDVFEPIALVNARLGRDVDASVPDIEADFDPSLSDLYLGTDGRPAQNQIDFRTIVLHEIGHGLGLVGSGEVSNGRAVVGQTDPRSGIRNGLSWDEFTYATSSAQAGTGGSRILSLPDGSTALRDALTGNQLYWAGQQALSATAGRKVRLFAPATFSPGSTYSHVDEGVYPRGNTDGLMTPVIANGESYAAVGPLALGMLADMGFAVPALTGSRYTALDPVRLLDTRDGTGAPRGRVGAGGTLDLTVTGVPANATAVVLNVTGVAPSADTDVRVYPTPVVLTPVPLVSNLNLDRNGTRANLVTVPLGNNGRVRLRNNAGSVSLLADLSGYYAPRADSGFTAVDPTRLLDTRSGVGTSTSTRVPAGGFVDLQATGNGPVPAGATAVALTVTGVAATQSTDVRVYPTPLTDATPPPTASNLNLRAGTPVPNVVVVRVGQGGKVRLRNQSGEVHLLADVAGYFSGAAGGALLRPVTPTRILDTRSRLGTSTNAPTRVGAGQAVDVRVAGGARVPRLASAAVLNVTGVGASANTDVRAYPATAGSVPNVSNLNLGARQTNADLVLVKLGNGRVRLRNNAGTVGLVADVAGWYGPES